MSEIKVQHPENKNGSVVSVREGCSLNTNNSLQQGLDSQDVKLQILNQSETWLDGHNSKLLGLVIKSSIFFPQMTFSGVHRYPEVKKQGDMKRLW